MSNKEISTKKILLVSGVAVLLALVFNAFSEKGIPLLRSEKTFNFVSDSTISVDTQNNFNEPQIISLQQAYYLWEKGNVKFIDARDKWDFADGHITGAINIPQYKFEEKDPKVKSLARDLTYIIYCNDDDCDTSKRLAMDLAQLSFKRIYIFEEGWHGWKDSNFPIEKSELE